MAQIKNSPLEGMRGTIGDLVFRTWNGKTFVYARSNKPRKQSAAQKSNRDRFRNASIQAKQLLADPTLQKHYNQEAIRLGLPNAYTAALKDMISVQEQNTATNQSASSVKSACTAAVSERMPVKKEAATGREIITKPIPEMGVRRGVETKHKSGSTMMEKRHGPYTADDVSFRCTVNTFRIPAESRKTIFNVDVTAMKYVTMRRAP
jgi:hypothetical protein